jgi:16S rRNA processing protein RimM
MDGWDDMVLVGRVARTHGLRGDVIVNPETDFVADRFRVGERLWTQVEGRLEQLTIAAARLHGARPIVGFDGVERIEDAERLAGLELRVEASALRPLEAGQYYLHQLVGCAVVTIGGDTIGRVERVDGGAGDSRLVVTGPRGEVLIPLAQDICRVIDVAAGRIEIDPPDGLLDLNAPADRVRQTGGGA